jgi:hypothetical protein
MSDELKLILDRLDALEKRVEGLDNRTVGQVRFGPREPTIEETAARARKFASEVIGAEIVQPVDRSQICLTDGEPITEDHRDLKDNGQQKGYVVLTEQERRKGFVRPVRDSYNHAGKPGPQYPLRDLTEDERKRYSQFGYMKFEAYPPDDSPVTGKYWTQRDLDRIGSGCGSTTTMGRALAETYARDPTFYSGTFCVHCARHFPVDEFVWSGTSKRVGS